MDLSVNLIIQDALIVCALVAALAGLFATGRGLLRAVRRFNHHLDDVMGTEARPGVAARPSLVERLASIEHELHPNSGGSLRDAVDRTERRLSGLELRLQLATLERQRIIDAMLSDRRNLETRLGADFGPAPDFNSYLNPPTDKD